MANKQLHRCKILCMLFITALLCSCSSAPICDKIIYGGQIPEDECRPPLTFYLQKKAVFDQVCGYQASFEPTCNKINSLVVYCPAQEISYGSNAFYDIKIDYEKYSFEWRSALRVISGAIICEESGTGVLFPFSGDSLGF